MTPEQAAIRRATRLAQRAVVSLDAEARGELVRAYRGAAGDLKGLIAQHAGPDDAVRLSQLRDLLNQVEARLARLAREQAGLLGEGMERSARYGAAVFAVARDWLSPGDGAAGAAGGAGVAGAAAASAEGALASPAVTRVAAEALGLAQAFVAADGLQLSDRVWRVDRQAREAVTQAIERAVIEGESALQAAQRFLARGEAVPPELARKMGAPASGRLGAAAAAQLTGQGSAMDNAMRVMRTEINRAHGEAYMLAGEGKPYFGGWRYLLSPAHPEPDICDLYSSQNVWGLGKGVYPNRSKTPWPAHPNTLSFVEIVFKDDIGDAERAGKETPMQALARLDPATRRGVLGKNKAEAFDAGQLTQGMIRARWRDVQRRIGGEA